MRVAYLCKRHYTGKDVITDRFGRLYEIPYQLALLQHKVKAWCLDYYGAHDENSQHEVGLGSLTWSSFSVKGIRFLRLPAYYLKLRQELEKFKPDIIIGASDIPHVWLASFLSQKLSIPCVVDLYDNFESFGQARIPGFKALLKYAIQHAHLVVTVSQPLKDKVQQSYSSVCPIHVMTNGINKSLFSKGDKYSARRALGLPLEAKLIGTAGGLSRMKGVDTIYEAWPLLEKEKTESHLVLAGPIESSLPIPISSRVHYLGVLTEQDVAVLFQALDVGIISLQDSAFGRYCFPQKLHEMIACDLPIVATDVGVMSNFFSQYPQLLYAANNPRQLAKAVKYQLANNTVPDVTVLQWSELVSQIEREIKKIII